MQHGGFGLHGWQSHMQQQQLRQGPVISQGSQLQEGLLLDRVPRLARLDSSSTDDPEESELWLVTPRRVVPHRSCLQRASVHKLLYRTVRARLGPQGRYKGLKYLTCGSAGTTGTTGSSIYLPDG